VAKEHLDRSSLVPHPILRIPILRENIIAWWAAGVRRGPLIVLAHKILIMAYHIIKYKMPYKELGADYLDYRRKAKIKVSCKKVRRFRVWGSPYS
jgi:hypothetical protein